MTNKALTNYDHYKDEINIRKSFSQTFLVFLVCLSISVNQITAKINYIILDFMNRSVKIKKFLYKYYGLAVKDYAKTESNGSRIAQL